MKLVDWTKLPSLTSLRAFEATAQTKSFSGAARSLNVTHAAVAQQVSYLEEFLGFPLVQRSTRGLTLTSEGEELARNLTQGFSAIVEGIEKVSDRQSGRPVRLTITSFFAESVILPRISEFWSSNPGIEVALTPTDDAVDLIADGYDLAVRAGVGPWDGLLSTPLFTTPTIACAAPHIVDDPTTDWNVFPWLLPDDTTWERLALEQSGIDTKSIKTIDLGDPAQEISAAKQGLGLLVESEVDLRKHLEAGSLKIAPIEITHSATFHLVQPPWPQRPAVKKFARWLQRLCKDI